MHMKKIASISVVLTALSANVFAGITLDRTRIIFNSNAKSVSLGVANNNKELPYLAQSWIENEAGEKINKPFAAVPPIQRVEADKKSQVKIIALPAISQLPQDRESVFYFNLREIPPKSDKENVLQIAIQSKVKLFYRPDGIEGKSSGMDEVLQQLQLVHEGGRYTVINPTAYYITIVEVGDGKKKKENNDFSGLMLEPKSKMVLSAVGADLGETPVLTLVNDYGGFPRLYFQCLSGICKAKELKS
jgi:chaperone protein PapD